MKKNKLLVTNLALATTLGFSGIAVATATSVSCAREKEKIIFGVSFSRGKEQWTALDDIIQKYNTSAEHRAKKGFKEVELKNIGSGYGAAHKKIVGDIQSKNRELPNITANYGATIAELVATRRYLDLKDADAEASNSLDIFSQHFTGSNSKVAGLKEGGVYLLPFLKSSVVHGINGPVYKHIFKSLKEINNGIQIDQKILDLFKVNGNEWETDIKAIKETKNGEKAEFLGEIDKEKAKELFKNKIEYSIFENGKDFLQFIINVKKAFKNSSTALLGIDDISGFVNPLLFAALNGDESKMNASIKKNAAGEITISYENAVTNENHEAYKKSKEIFDLVKQAIETKAIKIFGDGSYASADATNHKLGSNLGSSAGYTHNFLPGVNLYNIVLNDQALAEDLREISTSSFKLTKFENEKAFWFNQENETVTKYHNKFLKSNETGTKYDFVLEAKYDSKYDEIKKVANQKELLMFIKKDNKEIIESLKKATSEIDLLVEGKQNGVEYIVYSFKKGLKTNNNASHYKVIAKTSDKTLQESELVAIKPFTKWESTNQKSTNFLQGPNLMGIRNNANEDRATKLFFKFLTSNKKLKFTDQTGTYEETPMEHIFRVASYVVPYKGFEKASLPTSAKDNKYLNVCFDLFKEAAEGKVTLYEEPASANADTFRNLVNSQYKALYTTIEGGKPGFEYKKLADEIKSRIKTFK